jgi:predicted PurR-regulated permease PerM
MASDQIQGPAGDPAGGHSRPAKAMRYASMTVPSRPAVVAVTAGILLAAVLLAAARALPIFVVGLALAYLIDPGVTALSGRGVPRWLASVVLVIVMMVALFAFALIVANSIVSQGAAFVAMAPAALDETRAWLAAAPVDPRLREQLVSYASGLGASLGAVDLLGVLSSVAAPLFSVFDATMALIGLPFYVFLVVVDRPGLATELQGRLPDPWREDILAVSGIIGRQFGNYIRSEAILMVLLGLLTWIGLMLLALVVDPRIADYALFLTLIAAFSELIPLFGPWIATIPAVIYGLTLGPVPLIAIIVLYVLISFIEGNVLVPAIEGRSFALRPAVVGPVITIGLALGGAFGAVLAVPAASVARDVYLFLFRRAAGAPPRVAAAGGPLSPRPRDGGWCSIAQSARTRGVDSVNPTVGHRTPPPIPTGVSPWTRSTPSQRCCLL